VSRKAWFPTPSGPAAGIGPALRSWGYDAAVRARLLSYRPYGLRTLAEVDELYEGSYAQFADIDELPRYSVLAGYVRHLGGCPAILDVGCGPALVRDHLEGLAFTRYVGLDSSPAALARAECRADDRTSFVLTDRIGPGLGTFDVAICNEMLYMVAELDHLLAQIESVLLPGGHLLASNWRHRGDCGLHRKINARFDLVDAVDVRNLISSDWRRWRMTCHRRRD
jgi:SAM-dependent methyltransferase